DGGQLHEKVGQHQTGYARAVRPVQQLAYASVQRFQKGQRISARTRVGGKRSPVSRAAADERHAVIEQISYDDFAGLAGSRHPPVLYDLQDDTARVDVVSVVPRALEGHAAVFARPVQRKDLAA